MSLAGTNIPSLKETIDQVKDEIKNSHKTKTDKKDVDVDFSFNGRKELTDIGLINAIDEIDSYILKRVEQEEKALRIKTIVVSLIGIISLIAAVISLLVV